MSALLFDENLSRKLVRRLADLFPGPEHVCFVGLLQADAYLIWEYAMSVGYCLVTADADLYELATSLGPSSKGIWLRGCHDPTAEAEDLIRSQATRIVEFLNDPDCAVLILRKGS